MLRGDPKDEKYTYSYVPCAILVSTGLYTRWYMHLVVPHCSLILMQMFIAICVLALFLQRVAAVDITLDVGK